MFFHFMLFSGSRIYEDIKNACHEYLESIKMVDGSAKATFQKSMKVQRDTSDKEIEELCKQVENLLWMMKQQPKQSMKQMEPGCYTCGEKAISLRNVG